MLRHWLQCGISCLRGPWRVVQEAQRVVREHHIPSLETIEATAEHLGFPVAYVTHLPDKVDGLAVPVNDRFTVIAINRHHPVLRQRYSIAHELGHCLLHIRTQASISRRHADLQADCFAFTCLVLSIQSEKDLVPFVLQDRHIAWKAIAVATYVEIAQRLNRVADWLTQWLPTPHPKGA